MGFRNIYIPLCALIDEKMVDEKKILIVFLFIVAGVLIISFSPGLTGYSINEGEESPSLTIIDALAGTTLRTELALKIETDTVSYGKMMTTGEAADWIHFVSEDSVFLPEQTNTIPLYITIPKGTEEGEYDAKIALLSVGEEGAILEDQIISYIPIHITVTDEEKEGDFAIQSLTFYDAESQGKVYFQAVVENEANNKQDADMRLSVYDDKGALVLEQISNTEFLAFEKKEIVSSLSENLKEGKYYAKLSAGEESQSAEFSVVEEGSMKRKGEFLYLETRVAEDSLVTIDAYFLNSGEGVEYVSLDGVVSQKNEVIETLTTEAQTVLPGEYGVFSYSYSQPLQGAYTLDAEISSGNVVLAEKSAEFYSSDAISLESNVIVIISLVMLLLIVTHFMLSRRKE